MAYSFVKVSSVGNVTASPALPTFTGGNTAGNMIVVAAVAFAQTGEFITSITDTQGNNYVSAATIHIPSNELHQVSFWIAKNIVGGVANNVVTVNYTGGIRTVAYGLEYSGQAANPVDATSLSQGNSNTTSISYTCTCAASGELIISAGLRGEGGVNWSGLSGTSRTATVNQLFTVYDVLSSVSGANTVTATSSGASLAGASLAFTPAPTTFNISGNAGTAGATVSWSGTSSGSVTADGSGNYTISGLANGPYTITPSKTNFTFSPTSSNQTVSGANITGVNFTATQVLVYSVPDCRVAPFGPNSSRTVQGTKIYDVQISDNASVPGKDSRSSVPADSRVSPNIPQNSRAPGTFGPGE